MGFSSRQRYSWELFGKGMAVNFYTRFSFDRAAPRLELNGEAAFFEDFIPLKLTLYGALDERGMDTSGATRNWGAPGTFGSVASAEYHTGLYFLTWLWGGEAELDFFSLEINRGFSHLYSNRIHSTLAYRWVLFDEVEGRFVPSTLLGDSRIAHSLVFRLKAAVSTIVVTAMPLRITPELFGIIKLSALNEPLWSRKFSWGFGVSVAY
jgi:hypothetical protein